MRLQVLICPTAQGPAEYSFLEITQPTFTLEELAASIEARHTRLYPHQPQLIIHKLQDADSNDLDLEYTVGDVFSDKSKDKSSSVVRVIRSVLNRAGSIPPESGLRPQRKHGRERAPLGFQRRGGSHLSHSFTPGDVFDEVMLDEELESGESFQEGERKRSKPMTEDGNDEENFDGLSFKQQRRESSVEEVIPESSYIGAEDSLVWSTDGHQRPNRRLFARPSSPIHGRNLASSLNKAKGPNTPDFQFTRTRKSAETRVEVLGTQASQPLPFQEKDTPHPRRLLTNGAPAILSPGSTVDAKEEELTSSASIRSSHSPFLAREAPHSAGTLNVRSTNSMQDTSKSSVLTQAVPPEAYTQSFQQALRHRTSPPLDTPSTQLLIGLALQESAVKSPLSEKTTDQIKLAMERDARAVAAEARRQKQLDTSTTDEDIDDEGDETTDSETEQQMEEELKKVEEKARKEKEDEARKAKEEEARKENEDEARKAKEEEARWEQEEATRKEQEEACKAKEEEARNEKEELARKAQEEEERKAREEKARKGKEDEEALMKEQQEALMKEQQEALMKEQQEALMKEQQEAEERKAEEAPRKAEEAKAAVEAENKKKASKAAQKEAVEKKKAEEIAEKPRKKQEQEELTKIEKESKERPEESERKKQERTKQREKGKSRKNAKAPEDAEENSPQYEDTTPKAPEVPASQAGKKRQRPLPNERPLATEDAPQGKKRKTAKAKQANNPEVDDAPLNPDLHLPATPKVVSALRKISPNGTPAAKARRSVSFMDMTASVSTPQNSSASEAPAKVYPKTPVPPPMSILGAEPTLAPAAKRAAKSKTPIPLPDLRATMKVTASNAAPIKTKAIERKPVAAKGNKSKLSEELVEESESESDNAQKPSKPVQKVAPPTQDRAKAGTQKKATATKVQKETVPQTQDDSDIDMDYIPTNGAPKAGGRVTRAVVGAVLHEPLPKPTRGKKVAEVAPPPLPAFTSKPVHDIWNLSSTSEEDEEGEKDAGRGRSQNIVSERAVVVPEANPTTKPNTKLSSASSETETTFPNYSESDSDDASPPQKPTSKFPSPKAQQIANNLTKALGRTIENNTTTPTASQQIPPSSQPVNRFLPPSTQKYKSLSQYAVEEDYPEVMERLSSQTAKKRDAGSDSDDEDEEESSSESENGSDSDSTSGADIIPNTKRASGAASADKKKSGGRNSLGGFLNRRKTGQSTR